MPRLRVAVSWAARCRERAGAWAPRTLIFLGCAVLHPPVFASNLLQNPGFQTSLSGWQAFNGGAGTGVWSSLDADGSVGSGSAHSDQHAAVRECQSHHRYSVRWDCRRAGVRGRPASPDPVRTNQ